MKLVVMGTGPFAVPSFRALIASRHEIDCLITRPEKRAHRRKPASPNPMREVAEASRIPVFAPQRINAEDGLAQLAEAAADLFVVCDYGQILSREALALARYGGINLHGSLLPTYRGAAPINWALLQGETEAGVTVIHMTPRLDGGPMLVQRAVDVGPDEDAVHLEARLAQLGVPAVLESIKLLEGWDGNTPLGRPQDPTRVTKAPRLTKADGAVDWSQSAEQLFNHVRAMKPWPGSYTNLLREQRPPLRVILHAVHVYHAASGLKPGQACLDDQGGIVVQCGRGSLAIVRLQPAGKRDMESAEFVRGYGATLQFGPADSG